MVADDRPRPISDPPIPAPARQTDGAPQTAAFTVGALQIELTAAPGAARLVVAGDGARDIYVVEPHALATWASAIGRLLALVPASRPTERAEYRSPFLLDREARPSIAFEGLVGEQAVSYRLLVTGADARIAGLMTTADVIRAIAEAAAGAVVVASAANRT